VTRSRYASAGSDAERAGAALPALAPRPGDGLHEREAEPGGPADEASLRPGGPGLPRLRILHVFRAPVGGLFRHVQDLAGAQAAAGHAVGLLCDVGGGPRADATLAGMAPRLALGVTRIPIHRHPGPNDVLLVARARLLVHRLAPDVVHGHGAKGGLAARLPPALGLGGRFVTAYTPHGGSLYFGHGMRGHTLYSAVEQFLVRGTDALTFESQFAADRFASSMSPGDAIVRVIRNGAHPHEFAPVQPDPDATDLLYLGEFRAVKGLDVLLGALGLLRERQGREVSLTLIGAGPDEASLRAMITQMGFAEVRFETPRPAREALRRGRVLVLPSRAESLPYVLIEAAAAGVPIVATNVGGIAEIMAPFAFALVGKNDPQALADAIEARLGEPPALRQFAVAAMQKHVRQNLSVDRMAREVEETYREALDRRGLIKSSVRQQL
jgi:glycosyltransferase involved in cell wall biosynthesis